MNNFMKLSPGYVLFIGLLSGCSLTSENIDVSHIDSETAYFDLNYAQRVVQNIDQIQSKRTEMAWEEGVSLKEKLIANAKGVDPYIGWSPKIQQPAIEIHTKSKYQDMIELALLFDSQPVEVVANDDLILITFPQNYLWTFSNRDVSPNAKTYIDKAIGLIDLSDVRLSIYSQESFKDANLGKVWRSQAKADRFRQFLISHYSVSPQSVEAFGLGSKIPSNQNYFEGDFVQLAIYHNYSVDSSDYAFK